MLPSDILKQLDLDLAVSEPAYISKAERQAEIACDFFSERLIGVS
jgi:hypothetical protein